MKRLFILLVPVIFLLFVGCGGDDSAPPPQPPALNLDNKNDQAALVDLQLAALRAKESCTQSYSPMFLTLALGMQSGGNAAALLPLLMSQNSGGGCSNAVDNLLMNFTTLAQGRYANEPSTKPWLVAQLGGIVNRIGSYLSAQGVQITPEMQKQMLILAAKVAKDQIAPGLSGPVRGPACSTFASYGGGC